MVRVNNGLFMPFLVAVILSKVTPASTCTFYNYPNNTAMVKRIGDFFGTQDIHGCMWHCYNTANCVMIRYLHANKKCLLLEASDTGKAFPATHPTIALYRLDRNAMERGCPSNRLISN